MDLGVDEGGAEPFVSHEGLDGGDGTACVDQLGGVSVSELVGCCFDPSPFASGFDTVARQVFAQGLVAVEKDMVVVATASFCQVSGEGGTGTFGEVDGTVFLAFAPANDELLLG